MRPLFSALCAALLSGLAACTLETTDKPLETRVLELEPFLVPCYGLLPQSCLVARWKGDSTPPLLHYTRIEGFDFVWGVRQTLEVEIRRVENPPADASDRRYILVQRLKADTVGEWSFPHILRGTPIERFSGDTLRLEGYPASIRVHDAALRARIAARTASDSVPLVFWGIGGSVQARLDSLAMP